MAEAGPPQALVFDLDDTLCPERPFVLARLRRVAEHLRRRFGEGPDFEAELVRAYEADLRTRVFDVVLERAGIAPEPALVRELVDLYRSGPVEVAPYPEVPGALERWSRRLPLGLVTDGYGPTQRRKVEALGIGPFFQAIVYTDDLGAGAGKPSEVPFRRVAEALGVEEAVVYVGDNPRLDFPAPRRLGWTVVRVVRPGGKFAEAPPPAEAPPDFVIRSLDELDALPPLAGLA